MKYPTHTLALGLVLALTGGGTAMGGQPADLSAPGPLPFAAFDQDGNGVVTQQEFETVHAQHMAARAAVGAPLRGAVNPPTFAQFDANGDGQLTPDELAQGQQRRRQGSGMGPGMAQGMGPGMGPGMGMGPGRGGNMPAFADFDANGDGTLTEQEFNEGRAKRIQARAQQGYPMRNLPNAPTFQSLDLNGDGRVDPQEFAQAQAQHRQRMMQSPAPAGMQPPAPVSAQPDGQPLVPAPAQPQ